MQLLGLGANQNFSGRRGPLYNGRSLHLDFIRSTSLLQATKRGTLPVFQRSSLATRVNGQGLVESVLEDNPRFDHNGEGIPQGILLEGAQDNEHTQPNNFSDTGDFIISAGSAVENNVAIAPNGLQEADRFFHNASGNANGISSISGGFSGGEDIVWSFFYNPETGRWLRISIDSNAGDIGELWLDCFENVWGNVAETTIINPLDVQTYPNGWRRAAIIGRVPAGATTVTKQFRIATGDGSSSEIHQAPILFWGAMLEKSTSLSSLIQNVDLTRQSESLDWNVTVEWYTDPITLRVKGSMPQEDGNVLVLSDGSVNNQIRLVANGDNLSWEVVNGGVLQSTMSSTIGAAGTDFETDLIGDAGTVSAVIAGQTVNGTGPLPSGLSTASAKPLGWHLKTVEAWPRVF